MRARLLYLTEFRSMTFEEALPKIIIAKPFRNETCIRCHSMAVPSFKNVGDHASMIDEIRADQVSCASEGCQGPVHEVGRGGHR